MRATVKTSSTVVALMVLMCVAGEAQVSLRPGLYERVLEVDAAGSTGKTKDTMCWTPEEAKDVVKTIATAGKETDCKVSDVKTAPGGKLTFNVSCKEGGGVTTTANDVTWGPTGIPTCRKESPRPVRSRRRSVPSALANARSR